MEKQAKSSNHLGGRPTLSPPPNEVPEASPYKILISGIDTLYLAIDIKWLNTNFFRELAEKKAAARDENRDRPFSLILFAEKKEEWKTAIMPHGTKGYEWLLIGKDFNFRIGNWQEPASRPSMIVEFHAEALWRLGYEKAIETVRLLITGQSGKIISIKPSRIDLCVDMLMPEKDFDSSIKENAVTRAEYSSDHYNHKYKILEGIHIGKGVVSARIYDKGFELKKSKKEWMYDVWGIEKIPDGHKIIRVEFQLRREAIKELGIDLIDTFSQLSTDLWGYCTEKWLCFKDHPEKHHSLRTTLPWWKAVQNGYDKSQKANPLVRNKAFNVQEKQLFCQAYGLIRSLEALKIEKSKDPNRKKPTMLGALLEFCELAPVYEKNDDEFLLDVEEKRSKYQRLRDRLKETNANKAPIHPPSPHLSGGTV
jgi:hypothetical protein